MLKECKRCGEEKPKTEFRVITEKRLRKDGSPSTYVKGLCKACENEALKDWQHNNVEHVCQRARNYYWGSPEEYRERSRVYYNNNKEKLKKYSREYRQKNKETLDIKSAEYRANHRELYRTAGKKSYQKRKKKAIDYMRTYSQNNKEKVNQWKKKNKYKRRAIASTIEHSFNLKQWEQVKTYFKHRCAYCGNESKLTQDHFIPVAIGGEYTINNITPACVSCNTSKNDSDFFEWYPRQSFYSKKREAKILRYLNYDLKTKMQQLALTI